MPGKVSEEGSEATSDADAAVPGIPGKVPDGGKAGAWGLLMSGGKAAIWLGGAVVSAPGKAGRPLSIPGKVPDGESAEDPIEGSGKAAIGAGGAMLSSPGKVPAGGKAGKLLSIPGKAEASVEGAGGKAAI